MSPDSYLERFDPTVKIKRLEAENLKMKAQLAKHHDWKDGKQILHCFCGYEANEL